MLAKALTAVLVMGTLTMTGPALPSQSGEVPEDSVACTIAASVSAGLVSLTGEIRSEVTLRGRYAFEVEKTGGGSSSSITQNGDFMVGSGEAVRVGSVTIDHDGRSGFTAGLKLTWPGGGQNCRIDERDLLSSETTGSGTQFRGAGEGSTVIIQQSNALQ